MTLAGWRLDSVNAFLIKMHTFIIIITVSMDIEIGRMQGIHLELFVEINVPILIIHPVDVRFREMVSGITTKVQILFGDLLTTIPGRLRSTL